MSELVVQRSDMKGDMHGEVIKLANELWQDVRVPRKVAEEMKKYMDTKHQRAWHCIVGRDFNLTNENHRNIAEQLLYPTCYCIVLYCFILYCIVQYLTAINCNVLLYIVLYCIVLCSMHQFEHVCTMLFSKKKKASKISCRAKQDFISHRLTSLLVRARVSVTKKALRMRTPVFELPNKLSLRNMYTRLCNPFSKPLCSNIYPLAA
ncbi:hypothetical protein FGIG_09118 [Fasciola gigantica]|uniref:Dynein light chain n=1 Tax=Fasciola gigantica TaxID=46835 RepID=A0A504YKQ4_FASGI|nr:hypothetical protein FGIG_09118 [Fasciola gigantica]